MSWWWLTNAASGIIVIYSYLNLQNHRWWWYSFYVGSNFMIWFLWFMISYTNQYLHFMSWYSTWIMYGSPILILSLILFITCGSVGTLASWYFLKYIYDTIKSEQNILISKLNCKEKKLACKGCYARLLLLATYCHQLYLQKFGKQQQNNIVNIPRHIVSLHTHQTIYLS
jgi:hypothetical protein